MMVRQIIRVRFVMPLQKKDDRIQVIHKRNAGVSAARNSGIEACTGDYICFVDGDDYVMPDYVSFCSL